MTEFLAFVMVGLRTGLDLLALALALPVVVSGVFTVMSRVEKSASQLLVQRIFHVIDLRLRNLLDFWGNLALLYVIARLAVWTGGLDASLWLRGAGVLACVALAFGLYTPVNAGWNAILMIVCRNRPLGLDKEIYFPLARRLEHPEVFARLRAEVANLMASSGRIPALTDVYTNITMSKQGETCEGDTGWGAWRAFFIRMQGQDVAVARAWLPRLFAEIDSHAEVYNATLSILDPGRVLDTHRGHSKGKVRYHLGLIVPSVENAWMDVEGERHHWHEGEGVLFDDMYRHTATNRADAPRVVLFVDILRDLPAPLSWVNTFMAWLGVVHPIVHIINARYDAAVTDFPMPPRQVQSTPADKLDARTGRCEAA